MMLRRWRWSARQRDLSDRVGPEGQQRITSAPARNSIRFGPTPAPQTAGRWGDSHLTRSCGPSDMGQHSRASAGRRLNAHIHTLAATNRFCCEQSLTREWLRSPSAVRSNASSMLSVICGPRPQSKKLNSPGRCAVLSAFIEGALYVAGRVAQ